MLTIGRFTCSILSDGSLGPWPSEHIIVDQAIAQAHGPFQTPINVPLLVGGEDVILIDAGNGPTDTSGALPAAVEAAGYALDRVTAVLVTHLHGDHVNGLLTDGAPTYPNARVHVAKADVDWVRETGRDGNKLLDVLEGAGLLAGTADLPDGIEAIDTPGHTPGHTVYRVVGDGVSLLVGGDIVVINEQIGDPSVAVTLDTDGPAAEEARRRFLSIATEAGTRVSLYHLEPGVARIEADGDGWRWTP